jgi:hypothetical protein
MAEASSVDALDRLKFWKYVTGESGGEKGERGVAKGLFRRVPRTKGELGREVGSWVGDEGSADDVAVVSVITLPSNVMRAPIRISLMVFSIPLRSSKISRMSDMWIEKTLAREG